MFMKIEVSDGIELVKYENKNFSITRLKVDAFHRNILIIKVLNFKMNPSTIIVQFLFTKL